MGRRLRAIAIVCVVVGAPVVVTAVASGSQSLRPLVARLAGPGRAVQGGKPVETKPGAGIAGRGKVQRLAHTRPTVLRLEKAHGAVFDVRKLKSVVRKRERPEHEPPARGGDTAEETETEEADSAGGAGEASTVDADASQPARIKPSAIAKAAASAPAPAPDISFDGLDFANWGAGHPPDTNGDVGPTYYIQTINTSIGIYDKSNGNRVAAFK